MYINKAIAADLLLKKIRGMYIDEVSANKSTKGPFSIYLFAKNVTTIKKIAISAPFKNCVLSENSLKN